MNTVFRRPARRLIIAALLAGSLPAIGQAAWAQSAQSMQAPAQTPAAATDARLRKIEAELRAVQRQVFPGGDGKFFPPEISRGTAPASGAPATTPATTAVTDLLTRMEAVEGQLARLTAQGEENGNRIAQLEARLAAIAPVAPPVAPAVAPAPAVSELPPAGAAPEPRPNIAVLPPAQPVTAPPAPAAVTAPVKPAPVAPVVAAPAKPAPAKPVAAKPLDTRPAAPSAARVAAVKAIEKPQSDDPGEDEYSYGYRLWEAKFFPEAVQQLTIFVDKYPRHQRISFARNLLGRSYLDDGKPREAAQWFLTNYKTDRKGARAPDSLLMLVDAMTQLKDSTRACLALGEFTDSFPKEAAGRLKSQYDATRTAAKCN